MEPVGGVIIFLHIERGEGLVAKDFNWFATKQHSSDPYVKIVRQGKELGRTRIMMKDLDPHWDEEFRLSIGAEEGNEVVLGNIDIGPLELQIFDNDALTEDDCMGVVTVPLSLSSNEIGFQWYFVSPGEGKLYCKSASGRIRCSVAIDKLPRVYLRKDNARKLKGTVDVGLGWVIKTYEAIDLDVSCVALDSKGNVDLEETVYYGNLANSNKSITHSGDKRQGNTASEDVEVLTCNLDKVCDKIHFLYFILTLVTPGKSFKDVEKAHLHVTHKKTGLSLCYVDTIFDNDSCAMFFVRLHRAKLRGTWILTVIEETVPARDFGSLIPEIKAYSRDILPDINIDVSERVAILRKGATIRASDYSHFQVVPESVTVGLSWDTAPGKKIDLDLSVICLEEKLRVHDTIFFVQVIVHSGDSRDGATVGFDESITVILNSVSMSVKYLCFVVTSFSGEELDDVEKAQCVLFDTGTLRKIAMYTMTNENALDGLTALVMCCLYRDDISKEWNIRIIGKGSKGQVAMELIPKVQDYLKLHPPAPINKPPEQNSFELKGIMGQENDENSIIATPNYD